MHHCRPRTEGHHFPAHWVPTGATYVCHCGKEWTVTHRDWNVMCGCGWERGHIYTGMTVNAERVHGVGLHFWDGSNSRLLRWHP